MHAPTISEPLEHLDSLVSFESSQGKEFQATLLRVSRFQCAFEAYSLAGELRLSEVLTSLRILVQGQLVYAGRGVISNLMDLGSVLVCEASLEESGLDITAESRASSDQEAHADFASFLRSWGRTFKVDPEFKVVLSDMQTFLGDLRLWFDQVEMGIRGAPAGDRLAMERDSAAELGESFVPAFDNLHERLEEISSRIEQKWRPAYQNFVRRQLHSLVMCSPFAFRTYHKPLGFAGDYEVVNMITRNPLEGGSLFAKVVNLWFLSQWPAKAHRNRIQYLKESLTSEALRAERSGRRSRVLNLGCGPARELQELLAESSLSDHMELLLLDFNDEAITHTSKVLSGLRQRFSRTTKIQLRRKSVLQVLKESSRSAISADAAGHDLIICAGLFDYLTDRTCKQLMEVFYRSLAPGGLIVASNVDDSKPFRHMLEFVLDWHLIYRNSSEVLALPPESAPAGAAQIKTDPTGVNLFLEVRKPDDD
jgi:extracellular factor (EF) 3-hydroxypalmitic acid methyl ester biosynthesis protein